MNPFAVKTEAKMAVSSEARDPRRERDKDRAIPQPAAEPHKVSQKSEASKAIALSKKTRDSDPTSFDYEDEEDDDDISRRFRERALAPAEDLPKPLGAPPGQPQYVLFTVWSRLKIISIDYLFLLCRSLLIPT